MHVFGVIITVLVTVSEREPFTDIVQFKLITLLVVDEHGEGFPVAWCIANREDRVLLIEFFTSICTKCGMVRSQWFMSDMADQYHLAWVSVFDDSPQKLVCTWHVDRAWRGGLAAACQGGGQAQHCGKMQ